MPEFQLATPPPVPVAAASERHVPPMERSAIIPKASPSHNGLRAGAWVAVAAAILAVLAGLTAVAGLWVWGLATALAAVAGFLAQDQGRRRLVLTLVPATLLTTSAFVPAQGRYLPAFVVVVALAVSSRARGRDVMARAMAMPRWAVWALIGYLGWMAVTSLTSIDRPVSLVYLLGSAGVLGITLFVIPTLPRMPLIRELIATLVVTAVVIVLSGLVLVMVRSVNLYGKSLGLYFFEEFTIAGRPTGLVIPQDYGPYVGPETAPLAIGIVGVIYLWTTSRSPLRNAWPAAGIVLLCGLVSTFSREGWLIAALACLAVAVVGRRQRPMKAWAMATGTVMVVLFAAGITNTLGVIGRMDLSNRWYGGNSSAVLLNPNVDERGEAPPTQTSTMPAAERIALCSRPGASVNPLYAIPTDANAPRARLPWRDTCNDPPGWQPQWGAPPQDWMAAGPTTTAVQLKGTSSLVERLRLWKAAAKAIEHSPAVGYGPATDATAIVPYLGDDIGLVGATTHSTFFRVAVEMGLPGLVAYLAIVVMSAWLALRWLRGVQDSPEIVLAASILAITAAEVTDTLLFGGVSFPGFWLAICVGLLLTPLVKISPSNANGDFTARSLKRQN